MPSGPISARSQAVTFDPFGDFATRGYLRNIAAEKDPDIVRRLEHTSFTTGLDEAFAQLRTIKTLSYSDVLATHKILFDAVYPWAGQDRLQTAAEIAVCKGEVLFAHPADAQAAIEYALKNGQDPTFMRDKPGEVMGHLAYGHPFLDGNGRTIMVVHSVMAQRAGISIDWASTNKVEYLKVLSMEIDNPGRGRLDEYLKSYLKPALDHDRLPAQVVGAPGLDGKSQTEDNRVLGNVSEPAVQLRYTQQRIQREQGIAQDRGRGGGR